MGLRTRRFAAGVLGVLTGIALLEGGVRLLAARGGLPEVPAQVWETAANRRLEADSAPGVRVNNLVLHPFVGFAIDPDGARAAGFPSGPVSELGFYGDSPLAPIPAGNARVAVVGGSFASQLCTRAGTELSAALRHHPRIGERPVSLDCLALGSAKQPQQLHTITWLASLGASWDLVVNVDGFNDLVVPVAYNHRKRVFRSYPHNWDRRASETFDLEELRLTGRIALLDEHRNNWARRVTGSAIRHSAAAMAVWHAADRRWERRRADLAAELEQRERPQWERASDAWKATGPQLLAANEEEAMRLAVEDWMRASRVLEALTRGLGIDYIHALQPNQYLPNAQPKIDPLAASRVILEDHFYGRIARLGYPLLVETGGQLREADFPFIDLTDTFEGETVSHWADPCCHLDVAGYRRVALRLGEKLAQGP